MYVFLLQHSRLYKLHIKTLTYQNCGPLKTAGQVLHTGGSRGQSSHGLPIQSVNGTCPPPAIKGFYHTKMAHILVSVYSVFFPPHSTSKPITINNIHIIDLVKINEINIIASTKNCKFVIFQYTESERSV